MEKMVPSFFHPSQLQHPKEMQLAVGLISSMLTAKVVPINDA